MRRHAESYVNTRTIKEPSRRHHYTPQFYLRQWASGSDRCVWQYTRQTSGSIKEKRVAPKATGFREDLYTVERVGISLPADQPDIIEKTVMSRVDNDAANVLNKLRSGSVASLTKGDRKAWALFLNSLLERTPDKLARNDEIARELATKVIEDAYSKFATTPISRERIDRALRNFDPTAAARNTVRAAMVKEIVADDFIAYVTNQSWCVIGAPNGFEFITSDHPLIVNFGDVEQRPIHWMSIALSPTELFVAVPSSSPNTTPLEDIVLAHTFALLTGPSRFVYARAPVVDGICVGSRTVNVRTCIENTLGRVPIPRKS